MSTKASSAKPGSPRQILDSLATFYERRWLIKYLSQRQMASSYQGSHLGLLWAFFSPLLMVALFTLIFSKVLGIRFREVTGDSSMNFGLYFYVRLLAVRPSKACTSFRTPTPARSGIILPKRARLDTDSPGHNHSCILRRFGLVSLSRG